MLRGYLYSGRLVVLLTAFTGCDGGRTPTFEDVPQAETQREKTPEERIDYAIGALSRESAPKAAAACKRLASYGIDAVRAIPDLEMCAADYPDEQVKTAAEAAIVAIRAAEAGTTEE